MKKKIISIVGLLLLAVAPTKMLAQIEVAPIVDFGGVSEPLCGTLFSKILLV